LTLFAEPRHEFVVNAGEVVADVALPHVPLATGIADELAQRFMCAKAAPIGVAVGNEGLLKKRRDHVAQGVMHDAVVEGRGAYPVLPGIVNHKIHVTTITGITQKKEPRPRNAPVSAARMFSLQSQ
jgi:hypothetical protein